VKTGQVPPAVPSTPAPMPGTATVITHGNPRLPEVALTFDDGPGEYTLRILAILQHYKARATFFSIGQNITQFPMYLQQVLAGNHAVGNHTFTHPHLPTLSFASIHRELSATQNVVHKEAGTYPMVFRPPYGEYNADVVKAANQLGMTVVTWGADAHDWVTPQPSTDLIASRILSAAGNGAIFLLHEAGGDRANTVAALPTIITGLQARGLTLVTLPQMLANLDI
jgi:peptidoglycan/xylan/chitin deacetylase (PgdA/CDA1 family)